MPSQTITVVLGGGRGSRLFPLTTVRAKPAVPLGGKYRLIDIPLSNAINSGLREIYVLTQFNSASLNAHINRTYRFDAFSQGNVEVLAAEQTDTSGDWYQGTADAVRQHLHRFDKERVAHVLILSGDHLYRMDYRALIERHEEADADITVSTIAVTREAAGGFGILATDADGIVRAFKEKPKPAEDLTGVELPAALRDAWGVSDDKPLLGSMGVYVFKLEALKELLADVSLIDFGYHILPRAIATHRVAAYRFDGYWEDIGTVRSFYEANLGLTDDEPAFRFYEPTAPIYTHARFLPPSVLRDIRVDHGFIADGCLLLGAEVVRSVIGLRSRVLPGARIVDSVVMGADYIESKERRAEVVRQGRVPIGIGRDASVRRAIIDKNARIGRGAVIHGDIARPDEDHEAWCVRDGIIIVKRNAEIPPGSVL